MELLLSLSKYTNNSIAELLPMPFERVLMIYNALASLMEQEKQYQEKQQQDSMKGYGLSGLGKNMSGLAKNPMGNMQGQINSAMSSMRSSIPNAGSFHL